MIAAEKQRNNKGIKNLRPWKKGQSGNPKGRPKKAVYVTTLLKEALGKVPKGEVQERTAAQLVVEALLRECFKGNVAAIKEVLDRAEGKLALPPVSAAIQGEVTLRVVEDR